MLLPLSPIVHALPTTTHTHMNFERIARAIDIGFGYTKLSQSKINANYRMEAMSFPSFPSSAEGHADIADGMMHPPHVVTVEVDGVRYLVGPDSMVVASGRAVRPIANAFFKAPQYHALFLGALAYMKLPPSIHTIHCLGAGLPLTVWNDVDLRERIKFQMIGTFTVPVPDSRNTRTITVERVELRPQVLGGLVSISSEGGDLQKVAKQSNLVIDVGYGTMLWITTQGLKIQTGRSAGSNGGASSMFKAVARMIDPSMVNDPRVLDRIDVSMRTGSPLILNGEEVGLDRCRAQATSQALLHLQEMVESVGNLNAIENIFLVGGGAFLYSPLMSEALGGRKIREQAEEPQYANVKGMQTVAEWALLR